MLDTLWDPKKRGTLILSSYRSGTHYLQQIIWHSISTAHKDYLVLPHGEFHPDGSELNIDDLNNLKSDYTIAILNSGYAKFFLTNTTKLDGWHLVHLTRNDKVSHFISEWIWRQNPEDQQGYTMQKFKHHNGKKQDYDELLNHKIHYDLTKVIEWLKEDLINYCLPNTTRIDYSQLKFIAPYNCPYQPNRHGLRLSDLFTNHAEIEGLLANYKIQ